MVQSPSDASVWHLQYWQAVTGWIPADPEKGFYVDRNTARSIVDLKLGTYDFAYDLKGGPLSGLFHVERHAVEVYPDENGDYLLVIPSR